MGAVEGGKKIEASKVVADATDGLGFSMLEGAAKGPTQMDKGQKESDARQNARGNADKEMAPPTSTKEKSTSRGTNIRHGIKANEARRQT